MPEDSGIYQNLNIPLNVEFEGAHQKETDYAEFFIHKGFLVRGRTKDGTGIHFCTFLYQQRDSEVLIDRDVNQSLFIAAKYTDEEKNFMHGTPFVNKGQNIEDYGKAGDIKIDESKEQVVWSATGRKYVCQTPTECLWAGTFEGKIPCPVEASTRIWLSILYGVPIVNK
jgi:hypothetical protein